MIHHHYMQWTTKETWQTHFTEGLQSLQSHLHSIHKRHWEQVWIVQQEFIYLFNSYYFSFCCTVVRTYKICGWQHGKRSGCLYFTMIIFFHNWNCLYGIIFIALNLPCECNGAAADSRDLKNLLYNLCLSLEKRFLHAQFIISSSSQSVPSTMNKNPVPRRTDESCF